MGAPENLNSPLLWGSNKVVTPSYGTDPAQYATQELIYNSYSGVDIVASFTIPNEPKPLILGELQTISYSIHRENTPVRCIGHTNPRGFVRGPRTIGGSLIFTQFNTYVFYRLEQFKRLVNKELYPLADMLPPFDIVLSFSNETGSFSKLRIFGVVIIDEGTTMSIDDLMTEQTYTFMARGVQPLTSYIPQGYNDLKNPRKATTSSMIEFR